MRFKVTVEIEDGMKISREQSVTGGRILISQANGSFDETMIKGASHTAMLCMRDILRHFKNGGSIPLPGEPMAAAERFETTVDKTESPVDETDSDRLFFNS